MQNATIYRNPWARAGEPENYTHHNAKLVHHENGFTVYRINQRHYDYVYNDVCVAQRAGFSPEYASRFIFSMHSGESMYMSNKAATLAGLPVSLADHG